MGRSKNRNSHWTKSNGCLLQIILWASTRCLVQTDHRFLRSEWSILHLQTNKLRLLDCIGTEEDRARQSDW